MRHNMVSLSICLKYDDLQGYTAKVITSAKCSQEKVDALRTYGAETIVAPSGVAADDPQHYQI